MAAEATSSPEVLADVVEICALLQCLGYGVKSMNTGDVNLSQDAGVRAVVINCESSGLNVVLEGAGAACSCPPASDQNSSFWQVSAVSGGKKHDTETGSNRLGSLPKNLRDRFSKELREMVRCIRAHWEEPEATPANHSASMHDIGNTTPEKIHLQLKADTPTRYRSLDTLTNPKEPCELPAPGQLLKRVDTFDDAASEHAKRIMCNRQSTYTLASTPGSTSSGTRHRSKTSSPIQQTAHTLLENLMEAEKVAEDLRSKLASIVKDFADEKMDSSMSSLALDVSKISLLKGTENSKAQFASSPNLSGLGTVHENKPKNRFRHFESVSTTNLSQRKATPGKEEITSKIKRLSPNFFSTKKDATGTKLNRLSPSFFKNKKDAADGSKTSKLNSLLKPKIVTPVRIPKTTEASPNMSASKKKYSHIKSTIPRASSTK